MSLPRYLAYKDSGVEWLGDVPMDWEVCALSYRYEVALGKMLDEKRITGATLAPYLRNTDVQWGRINTIALPMMDFAGTDLERYSLRPGDLLVCEGGEIGRAAIWKGEIEHCFYQKALHRLRARRPAAESARYLFYVLRAAADRGVFAGSEGRSTIAHLTAEALRRYRFPFPSSGIQQLIATFLDRETAKIDSLVAEQERLVGLLKEKRQTVISHAVTKGLNQNVETKASGVVWLGEVPEHWDIRKLRQLARLESGHTPSRQRPEYWIEDECVIPWFTLADVGYLREEQNTRIASTSQKISQVGLENSAARLLPFNTVILSRTASVGFSGITNFPLAVSQDFAAWVCKPELDPTYLLFCLRAMRPEFKRLMMGSTHQTIYMPDIEAFRVPFPPLSEQIAIVEFIQAATDEIDTLSSEAKRAIELLKERRSALISAAVTGKIDVRGLAPAIQEAA